MLKIVSFYGFWGDFMSISCVKRSEQLRHLRSLVVRDVAELQQ